MRVRIRVAEEADAAGMLEIYAPVVQETAISFETRPPTVAEFQGRIRARLERRLWLVGDDAGEIAGYAYATQFNPRESYVWAVGVSVYVHPGRRGRGIAGGLYTALFGGLAMQGYCAAVARIILPNPASVGWHENMGFGAVGVNRGIGHKNGQWRDVGVWQREIGARPASPQLPRTYTELVSSPQWAAALAGGEAMLEG